MQKWLRRGFLAAVIGGFGLAASGCGPNNSQNSLDPKAPRATQIDHLFYPVVLIAVLVFILVAGVLLVAVVKYRAKDNMPEPKQIHGNTPLEIGWTIVPFLILAVVSVFTLKVIFDQAKPASANALKVTVVGNQWWWQFQYPKQNDVNSQIVTANEMHIPVGRDINLALRACTGTGSSKACNVIHSFWVPELAGKKDVVPGRNNATVIKATKPGVYLGQCAEYCGLSHANMKLRVIAMQPNDFAAWITQQEKPPVQPLLNADGSPAGGADSAQSLIAVKFQCTNCHVFDNSSSPSYGPNLTHFASRTTFASGYYNIYDRSNNVGTPDTSKPNYTDLHQWVRNAPSLIAMSSTGCRYPVGVPNAPACNGMPSFSLNVPLRNAKTGEVQRDKNGNIQYYPKMTEQDATTIINYLLGQK